MAATAVTLCGIELENPIIPASGTFGYGQEFAQLYDINMLGTFSFKGTTRAPRFGNPHAAHRRVCRRNAQTRWGCRTLAWTRSSRTSCRS